MDSELDRLGERIAEQAAHLDAATYQLLVNLREFDERGGWYAQGALSCAHWLSWRVGWTLATARDRVRVANKLPEVPAISDALRRGEVSYSKVRAMLRIATPANEALLLDYARFMTASQVEETCRKYALVLRHGQDPHPLADLQRRYVRRRDTEDGMVKIEAVIHSEEAELIWTMLTHAAGQLVRSRDASPHDAEPTSNNVPAERREPLEPVPGLMQMRQGVMARDVSAERREPLEPVSAPMPMGQGVMARDVPAERHESLELVAAPMPLHQGMIANDVPVEIPESMQPVPPPTWIRHAGSARAVSAETEQASSESRSSGSSSGAQLTSESVPLVGEPNEAPDGESLLDRLLIEAEALRAAEDVSEGSEQPVGNERTTSRPASVLHQRADAAQRAFSRADALVALAQCYLRGDRPNRAPIEVVLTIPASSLRTDGAQASVGAQSAFGQQFAGGAQSAGGSQSAGGAQSAGGSQFAVGAQSAGCLQVVGDSDPMSGLHAVDVGELGESFISCETARRLSCDSGVVDMIHDDRGVPLSVGRKRRTMSGQLKRALFERDKTCTFPGCTNRLYLEGHHIKHWADGGETSLRNSCLLCSSHHHYVHEYKYTIELDSDQRPQLRDPHGRLIVAVPERPMVSNLGWHSIRAANASLAITQDTNVCKWDGNPVDYGAVIGYLVAADGLN